MEAKYLASTVVLNLTLRLKYPKKVEKEIRTGSSHRSIRSHIEEYLINKKSILLSSSFFFRDIDDIEKENVIKFFWILLTLH
ncbi:hypothetical protein [Dethiosulfatarculus sandiegensis]|uniref:hypothetical protein n=1 Tax=Dethiosulfatarculus sandiegensis TaxID=1429043 RepID=UPI0012E1A395|nr:hypothetical protein [Dethiosulfatarculus sandiegensis]